jgi:two-component system alkaline phosphatase synthesis response regulator PhoP
MPKKILVVDDEPDILKVVIFRLKKLGYEVISKTNGNDALAAAQSEKPDLIVMDYRMPGMNGLETAEKMRVDETLKKTPIILLSASSSSDISEAVKDAEVNEYIKKPFNPEQFMAAVGKYLEGK